MNVIRLLVIFAALALIGCASTPPSTFYRLSSLPTSDRADAANKASELAIGLGPVSFPVFLDRPQIVSRESDNRLRVDELNRWGGTLQDDFLRVWSENLAHLLGTGQIIVFPSEVRAPLDLRIVADILAFEGTADGHALLTIRWSVLDDRLERLLISRVSHYRQPLAPPGDEQALIAALSVTLGDFSREVAEVVRTLPNVEPPLPTAPF